MSWNTWQSRWEATLYACGRLGGAIEPLIKSQPATEEEIVQVEQVLGLTLPLTFRSVLSHFAAQVQVSWSLPEDAELPPPVDEIISGHCYWNLSDLLNVNTKYRTILREQFPDRSDPAQNVWYDKFVVQEVQNGDRVVLDLSPTSFGSVLYLSTFRGQGHGYRLGSSFIDFIDHWTQLGCPGPEIWQILPFLSSPYSGLEIEGLHAHAWRAWIGLDDI
jgi:cell wall assembly regulator SMI1